MCSSFTGIELVGGAAFVVVTWVRVYLYHDARYVMEECEVVGRRLSRAGVTQHNREQSRASERESYVVGT